MSGPNSTTERGVTDAPLKHRLSDSNHLVYVADPLSSVACRGVFVNDISTPWWWDAGLIYERQSAAAEKGLWMRAQSRQPSPAQAEPLPEKCGACETRCSGCPMSRPAPTGAAEGAEPTADAERYRWLREQSHPWGSRWLSRDQLDSAIDAARAAQKGGT